MWLCAPPTHTHARCPRLQAVTKLISGAIEGKVGVTGLSYTSDGLKIDSLQAGIGHYVDMVKQGINPTTMLQVQHAFQQQQQLFGLNMSQQPLQLQRAPQPSQHIEAGPSNRQQPKQPKHKQQLLLEDTPRPAPNNVVIEEVPDELLEPNGESMPHCLILPARPACFIARCG